MRPCIVCGRLGEGSRCAKHERQNAHQRGYDRHWRETRERFLAANPVCEECGAKAEHVHHLDGLGPRGPRGFDWNNLQSLCAPCHNRHTASEQASRDRRRL